MNAQETAAEGSEPAPSGARGTKREASTEPVGPSEKRAANESTAGLRADESLLCEWQQWLPYLVIL